MTTHLQFFLITVAGWVNRHQQVVIEYLQEENRILLEQLDDKPKRFTQGCVRSVKRRRRSCP